MARISRRTSSSRRTSAQPRAYRGRHLKLVIKYMAAFPDNVPDIHAALEVGVPNRTQNDHELSDHNFYRNLDYPTFNNQYKHFDEHIHDTFNYNYYDEEEIDSIINNFEINLNDEIFENKPNNDNFENKLNNEIFENKPNNEIFENNGNKIFEDIFEDTVLIEIFEHSDDDDDHKEDNEVNIDCTNHED